MLPACRECGRTAPQRAWRLFGVGSGRLVVGWLLRVVAVATALGGSAGSSARCGLTTMPGRARWMPLTITQSVGLMPSSMTRSGPSVMPSFTGRYSTTFLSLTTST